jgi:hypothetical protein
MIKVRNAKGDVLPFPADGRFVEVCDDTGKPACVFFLDDKGALTRMGPGDAGFERYCRAMRTGSSRLVELPDID